MGAPRREGTRTGGRPLDPRKSIPFARVGRALPPLAGSAYGMTSPAQRVFERSVKQPEDDLPVNEG